MPDRRRAEVIVDIKLGKIDLAGADISGEIDAGEAGEDLDDFAKNLALLRVALPKIRTFLRRAGAALKVFVNPLVLGLVGALAIAVAAVGIPLAKIIIVARLAGHALRMAFQVGLEAVRRLAAGVQDFVEGALDAIQDFASSAIEAFAEFEQQAANTTTVLGAFGEAAGPVRDAVMKMARDISVASRKSAIEIVESGYHIASAGFNMQETFAAMGGAVVLAEATLTKIQPAAETMVTLINQFGLAATEATRVANTLVAAIRRSPATMDKLRQSMEYIGPTASAFGESIEGTVAALMAMYKVGKTGARAGTELSNVLDTLSKRTDKATAVMAEYGIAIEDLSPARHTIQEIVAEFEKLRERVGAPEFMEILARAFTQRAARGMAALTRVGATQMAAFEQAITGTNDAVMTQADQLKTLSGVLDRLKSDLVDIKLEFKGFVQKALYPSLLAVHKLYEELKEEGVFKRFGDVIAEVGNPLNAFTEGVINLVRRNAPQLLEFFERAGKVARSVLGSGLLFVLRTLQRGIPSLIEFGNEMLDLVEKVDTPEMWEALNKVVGGFQEIIEAIADDIVDRLKVGLPKVVGWFKKLGDDMPSITERAKALAKRIGELAEALWEKLPEVLQVVGEQIAITTRLMGTFARVARAAVKGVLYLALGLNVLAAANWLLMSAMVPALLLFKGWRELFPTIGQNMIDIGKTLDLLGQMKPAIEAIEQAGEGAGESLSRMGRDLEAWQRWPPGTPERGAIEMMGKVGAGMAAVGRWEVLPQVSPATAGAGGTVIGPFYIDGSKQAGNIAKRVVDEHVKEEERAVRARGL